MKKYREKKDPLENKNFRRVTYRLYPREEQEVLLFGRLNSQRHLYNAMLEQRITTYRSSGKSLSYEDQCKEITKLRKEDPKYRAINAQSEQATAQRLQKAFENFYRRVKEGADKPGFPRYKSRNRFTSFGNKTYGDGWKMNHQKSKGKKKMRDGNLALSGIGKIKKRGSSKYDGRPKASDVKYDGGFWFLSVVIDISKGSSEPVRKKTASKKEIPVNVTSAPEKPNNPVRIAGRDAGGFDWGTESFSTVACEDGTYYSVPNPRNGMKLKEKLTEAHQELSKKKKGSKNRGKTKKKLQKVYRKIKNQRTNFLHQESHKLVSRFGILATEELDIQNLVEKNAYEKKHGLNREILDTAPSKFLGFCNYKAEEAGSIYTEIKTKKWKPSQTCSGCGRSVPKELNVRVHECPYCGLVLKRDENSSRVCLNVVLLGQSHSREPTVCRGRATDPPKQESPSIPECTSSSS